ncbi:acyltransferase family protein [Georgenia deserti]|uniref:Acyltransferase family protein n=1 Tax=Georgenia deserti TaxID=2093781 RepID=A0ABW4L245_9MICO
MTGTTLPDAKTGRKPTAHFRRDVQGLRAVAVLAVVADHLLSWPRGGFVGVDVFFVISGYLITGLLLREYGRYGRISFLNFYVRRIKRIVPAATFALGFTVCISFALRGWVSTRSVIEDAAASFTFVANWWFARTGTNYFEQDQPPSPLQHYWSLAVEEQFYLVWPWLLLGILLLGVRYRGWHRDQAPMVAAITIALISALSLAWAFYETGTDVRSAYFSTFSRAWELGIGAFVAVCARPLSVRLVRTRRTLSWIGLGGIGLAIVVVPEGEGFPAPWALVPVLSTAAVLIAGEGDRAAPRLLTNRASQYVGEISYSLYLWHFPVAVLLPTVLPAGSAGYYLIGLVMMFVAASLSHRYIEKPARIGTWFHRPRIGRIHRPSRGTARYIAGGVAVAVLCTGLGAATTAQQPEPVTVPLVLAGETDADRNNCVGAAAMDPNHRCVELNPEDGASPAPRSAADDRGNGYDCYMFAGDPFKSCDYGPNHPEALSVALVGDSHAADLLPALVPQLEAANWHVTTFVGNGCRWQRTQTSNCSEHMPEVQNRLLAGGFDLVIATESRAYGGPFSEYHHYMTPVVEAGTDVVVIGDRPDVEQQALSCVARLPFRLSRDCGTPTEQAFVQRDALANAASMIDIPVVDATDYFCRDETCPATIGNVIVYRDTGGHITATYAKTLGPYLVEGIESALT